ncbi:hypothetical protein JIN85_12820 [Luteolibacter pohnpeiensis]|uniref:Uncharacterized protein n=1 Tax=Luteolibacter pohnpeiensis TaxID=454153 RepID=A0A934SBV0_9BACT|nr:hypothetical protein [Luteolibacter pohnpeiensis]MBK1883302.1 hypothetical protein [Luteolibacter pohnpeiensis]
MSVTETEPINLWFFLPASDPLGRDEVAGKLRFMAEKVELHWRRKGNVFRSDDEVMTKIDLPYGEIEHVELVKKWWKIRKIVLRVGDPTLVAEIPGVSMGKLELHLDQRSTLEAKRLVSFIDFRRSIFLLDEQTKLLTGLS